MTADVYADDDGWRDGVRTSRAEGAATFVLVADADADLLGRVGAVLTLLNVAPRTFRLEVRPDDTATVEASIDCAEAQAQLVARKLQRLTSIRDVVVTFTPAVQGVNS